MTYEPRPIKRKRRTRAEMEAIRAAIYRVVESDRPMTVRQVFYRLVSEGVIEKSEREYKSTVGRLLTARRKANELPYEWTTDNTRWMREPTTFNSLDEALGNTVRTYRRSVWADQTAYVEVWCEKDALAGVLYGETGMWDVPLMVTRGFSSLTFSHSVAGAITEIGKPAHLYYLGDFDPSGIEISEKLEQQLRDFAPETDLRFERVAVTEDQIAAWNLPTRPTKRTDTRSKGLVGEGVEPDSIPPEQWRALVRGRINQHVDLSILRNLRRVEAAKRRSWMDMMTTIGGTDQRSANG